MKDKLNDFKDDYQDWTFLIRSKGPVRAERLLRSIPKKLIIQK